MGSVTQLHDPEGDRLLRLAASLGEENLSEGEKWRLANTRDARRRLEARAAQQGGRTDALDAQANERRFAAVEAHMHWAAGMLREGLPQVIVEVIGEAEQRAIAESKRLVDEQRLATDQKLGAQYEGFEKAVLGLRDGDRAALLETVRSTMSEAESRIDANLANALDKNWERCELEIAIVRDELLSVISERQYGRLADDDAAKHALAERAIAELRKRMTSVEEEGARQAARNERLAGAADRLAVLEDAYRKSTKSLLVRCAANHLAARTETERANELAGKVARLEAELERLTVALLERGVIS